MAPVTQAFIPLKAIPKWPAGHTGQEGDSQAGRGLNAGTGMRGRGGATRRGRRWARSPAGIILRRFLGEGEFMVAPASSRAGGVSSPALTIRESSGWTMTYLYLAV